MSRVPSFEAACCCCSASHDHCTKVATRVWLSFLLVAKPSQAKPIGFAGAGFLLNGPQNASPKRPACGLWSSGAACWGSDAAGADPCRGRRAAHDALGLVSWRTWTQCWRGTEIRTTPWATMVRMPRCSLAQQSSQPRPARARRCRYWTRLTRHLRDSSPKTHPKRRLALGS